MVSSKSSGGNKILNKVLEFMWRCFVRKHELVVVFPTSEVKTPMKTLTLRCTSRGKSLGGGDSVTGRGVGYFIYIIWIASINVLVEGLYLDIELKCKKPVTHFNYNELSQNDGLLDQKFRNRRSLFTSCECVSVSINEIWL